MAASDISQIVSFFVGAFSAWAFCMALTVRF